MSEIVIKVDRLSKHYRLGLIGGKTLREDIQRLIARWRGQPDPLLKIGTEDGANTEGDYLWALRDISFAVEKGEILGIIGHNGAGKSTLLKIISRITAPTSGTIKLKGRVGSLLEVGTGFHPELTGRENIYLNGAILGMRKAEVGEKIDKIIDFAEIQKFADTPVKRYSSGMYVRLAFAVAAHLDPELLIVDEVLAVGDADFQKKCLGKMKDISKEGRTVLFVSHNMVAMESLCDRCILLSNGKISVEGSPEKVVSSYLEKGAQSVLERVWDNPETAPGNKSVRLRSAKLIPISKDNDKLINVETPLNLEFVIWNNVPSIVLNFSVVLLTLEGVQILNVVSDARSRHEGLVQGVVKIPANFLNDGIYKIALYIVKDASSVLYIHPDILVFEVHDIPRDSSWYGKWPGLVRPKFEWDTKNISESKGHE